MKSLNKAIFWIIIGIFVLSSFLAFASFSIVGNPNNKKEDPLIISQEEKDKKVADKIESQYGKNIEGVLHKTESGQYSQGTHYLEVGGVLIALLETDDKKIDLNKYINKNVKVWGETVMTADNENVIMKVTKIE
jgi:hypothetical protein